MQVHRTAARIVGAAAAALAFVLAPGAHAQDFPNRPLKLVVPFPAGGIVDVTARQVGQKMSEVLGQPVVVDNRSGAGGSIGTGYVAGAPADGHTLLMAFDTHAVNPLIYGNLSFDTFRDFRAVAMVGSIPLLFATHPSFPASTVAEFVSQAKSRPGKLSYGSVGAGSSGHLAAEQFKKLTGTDLLHVPFKGGAPALNALLGEQIQLLVFAAGAAVPHVQAGKVKALAVTGDRRSAALPGVPTMKEAGHPELNSGAWMGILAPAATPAPVMARLQQAVTHAASDPGLKALLAKQAVDLAASTPAEFDAFIRAEHDKWGRLIKDARLDLRQ